MIDLSLYDAKLEVGEGVELKRVTLASSTKVFKNCYYLKGNHGVGFICHNNSALNGARWQHVGDLKGMVKNSEAISKKYGYSWFIITRGTARNPHLVENFSLTRGILIL